MVDIPAADKLKEAEAYIAKLERGQRDARLAACMLIVAVGTMALTVATIRGDFGRDGQEGFCKFWRVYCAQPFKYDGLIMRRFPPGYGN